jgi:hypothetical protein
MMHPQPTSVLLLNPNYELRIERHEGPGPLLSLLVAVRALRKPTPAAGNAVTDAVAVEPVKLPASRGGRGARARSGLGGRMQQRRRPRGARALRRGDIHLPGRRADRRG